MFSLQDLVEHLQTLTDTRDPRSVRDELAVVLLVAVLARRSGITRRAPSPIGCGCVYPSVLPCVGSAAL